MKTTCNLSRHVVLVPRHRATPAAKKPDERVLFDLLKQRHVIAVGGLVGHGKSMLTSVLFDEANTFVHSLVLARGAEWDKLDIARNRAGSLVGIYSFDIATPRIPAYLGMSETCSEIVERTLQKMKRPWTPALVQKSLRGVEKELKWAHVVFADLPGKISWVTECFAASVTGAGIISRTPIGIARWRQFFKRMGIPVLFEVWAFRGNRKYSYYDASRSTFRVCIAPFERDKPVSKEDRGRIGQLARALLLEFIPRLGHRLR